jgi:alpha-tubulin suppressor-like RCC1 family protein
MVQVPGIRGVLTMSRSFRPLRFAVPVLVVAVVSLTLTGCDGGPSPRIGTATAGNAQAVVSWQPSAYPEPIVGYVVTPWVGFERQTPVVFNSPATTEIVTGLTNGVTYGFTVHAVHASGYEGNESDMSNRVTPAPPTATALDAGSVHTCAVLSDGTADCWGDNSNGQLGNGTTTSSSTPVAVTGMTDASAISAGGDPDDNWDHTCARITDGTVKCWGSNDFGQLGAPGANSSTPVTVTGITTATAVAASGEFHSCALLADGTVKCWGANNYGQLGNGTTTNSSTPVTVTGITTATAISAGAEHFCALLTDGTVRCWGRNAFGQLGDGTFNNNRATPVTVTGITTAIAISAGGGHTCALLTDSTVKCWGYNEFGGLGNGTTVESHTPVPVTGISTATAISAGGAHSCALLTGGAAYCWGYNGFGGLGNGTTTNSTTPVPVTGITTAVVIDVGGFFHTCALLANGAGYCWGGNSLGQLGNGTTTNSTTPVPVTGL